MSIGGTALTPTIGSQFQANLYGQEMVEMQRVNKLLQLMTYAQQLRQPLEAQWIKRKEYYLSIDKRLQALPDHRSKVFIPRPYLTVEAKTPRIVQSVFSKNPIFTVLPVSKDDRIKALASTDLLSQQTRRQDNLMLEFTNWCKDSFIIGGSIGRSGWNFKQEPFKHRLPGPVQLDPFSGQLIQQMQVQTGVAVTQDEPFFKNIDVFQMYMDPTATSIENCRFIIQRSLVPMYELQYQQAWNLLKNVDRLANEGAGPPPQIGEYAAGIAVNTSFLNSSFGDPYTIRVMPHYDMVEILEFWWIDDATGMKTKTVLANRRIIVQDIPHPFWHMRWPYYLLKDVPLTGEFWGMGEIEPIMALTDHLNELRNASGDNIKQFSKGFWVVDRAGNIDMDMLQDMPPGGILEVTGTPKSMVDIMRPPTVDQYSVLTEQKIDTDIQMTTGVNDLAIGQPTKSQIRTATVGQQLAESTDTRFGLCALLYIEQMRKIGRDWLDMSRQFMTKPQMVRILGFEGFPGVQSFEMDMYPQDIPMEFDLFVTCGSELQGNKDIIRQQKMTLFQILAQIPGFRIVDYAKEMMSLFDEKSPERFFEGEFVIPTQVILQKLGVSDDAVMSSYLEQLGGTKGGFNSKPNPRAAIGMPDVLQQSQNPTIGTANVA